ncbi:MULTISPECIES: hypothetical protein [unclassified Corynebacterium]|uniref:hypothetical protein n=1 Tax=unclassified Corynebacterium TaxID=2624378 RepID=UPI002A91A38B|nr:hypothetical protein [Corynebacterium sp.]MDY5785464.1 hypothetical protein [Corynebacterium sp.]
MGATGVGIASIVVGFVLIGAAFLAVNKGERTGLAVALGIAAFIFITIIPVFLAVFIAVPNPG